MNSHLFPSHVIKDGSAVPDNNVFATAMAARAMRLSGRKPPRKMMDALAQCRSEKGGFRFWPPHGRPAWAPNLPDDCDDTALATLELYHSGHMKKDECRRVACLNVLCHRVGRLDQHGPPWRRLGVFKTWARGETAEDLVDCTAQANVLALLSALDLQHLTGFAETRALLDAALEFAGDDPVRAASLSPFYPTPAELVLALRHAAMCGAKSVDVLARRAAETVWGRTAYGSLAALDHPICCSACGSVVWLSPELAALHAAITMC